MSENEAKQKKAGAAAKQPEMLQYRGRPIARSGNIIYYGSMADKYIVMMQVMATEPHMDMQMSTKVNVQLELTDQTLRSKDRIVRKVEKDSLYKAIDIASVWLDRAASSK